MLRSSLLVLTAFALLAADAPKADKPEKKDEDLLQGTWVFDKGTRGGKPAPDEVKGMKLTFKGDKMTAEVGGQTVNGTFKLDPSKKPKQIDVEFEGMKGTGIYELDGDKLTICHGEGDEARPTEFKSPENTTITLVVLKREKK